MYSQNNEEAVITGYFGERKGTFIDIGAYDGIKFSNVRKLAESGWTGILFEPDRELYEKVVKNYEGFPAEVKNLAVDTFNGEITFYSSGGDAVGTTSTSHIQKWHTTQFKEGVNVPCVDINEVIVSPTEFVNIDVEGTNINLFRHMTDEVIRRIEVLCIEHDGYYPEMIQRMNMLGYKDILFNGENVIFVKYQ
jgi:FkbM family methyltransferase